MYGVISFDGVWRQINGLTCIGELFLVTFTYPMLNCASWKLYIEQSDSSFRNDTAFSGVSLQHKRG